MTFTQSQNHRTQNKEQEPRQKLESSLEMTPHHNHLMRAQINQRLASSQIEGMILNTKVEACRSPGY